MCDIVWDISLRVNSLGLSYLNECKGVGGGQWTCPDLQEYVQSIDKWTMILYDNLADTPVNKYTDEIQVITISAQSIN